MQRPTVLNIFLLGRKGDGRSSSIKTILGENSLPVSSPSSSLQTRYPVSSRTLRGKTIRIVETPGLFDTSLNKAEFQDEMVKCMSHCPPGPHAFIIILQVGRFTTQEATIVEYFQEQFGEDVLNYAIVLFTNGDQLEDDQTIEEFVHQSEKLQELVDKCGGRVHVLDNKYWKQQQEGYRSNRVQVEKLLNTIEEMVKENGGHYYSEEMLPIMKKSRGFGKIIGFFDNIRRMVKKNSQRKSWAVMMVTVVLLVGVYKLYY